MLSIHGHNCSKAEHLRDHHLHLPATSPLPAPANAELFIETIFRYRDQSRFQVHGFVVMPDHVHVLVTPAIDQSTAKCIQYIKGGYSFAARQHSAAEIWHSGHHEHRIRDTDDYNNQLLYIANNPNREDYPHTQYPDRLDPIPDDLLAPSESFVSLQK